MLAEETARAYVVYNKYRRSYSYLNFKLISIILYHVGALALIFTDINFTVLVIHATYTKIKTVCYQYDKKENPKANWKQNSGVL